MTWAKIDDQFHAHPKVQKAWQAAPRAIGLHLLALSHASAYLTDGHVSEAFVTQQVPVVRERLKTVDALLDAGLWHLDGDGGWEIHDYLEFNDSRAKVEARRRADSKRKNYGKG